MTRQRAIGQVGIHRKLFIAVGWLEPRQERERAEQDVLIPGSAAEAVVVAFDVLALQLQFRQLRRDVSVHHALPSFLDISVGLQWTRSCPSKERGPGIAGEIQLHAFRWCENQSPGEN